MNNMEQLENQLRSWVPRRPSARVKQNIFGNQSAIAVQGRPDADIGRQAFAFGWLAPATAAFVLLCMLFNQRQGGGGAGGTNSGHFLAVISSNQSFYPAPGIGTQQNRPSTDTFDWTNDSSFTSSVRSFFGPKAQH